MSDNEPVVSVQRGSSHAHWDGGAFTGSGAIAGPARFASLVGLEVPVGDELVVARADTARGALAALLSAGGTIAITRAPQDVLTELGLARTVSALA